MPQRARPNAVRVKLTDPELAALRARAQERRSSMAAVLRGALTEPPPALPEPSWERTLGLLARAAEAGDVRAMIALARELHPVPAGEARRPDAFDAFGLYAVK